MQRKNLIILFIAALFLVGACSIFSHTNQTVPQTSSPQGNPSQPPAATQPPLAGGNGQPATQPPLSKGNAQGGPKPDIQKTFPMPPDSQVTSPDDSGPKDTSGSFTIQSQSAPDAVVKFYADALPKQGWTLRYTDANFTGGATQYWKIANIYLSLDIGFEEGQLKIRCEYNLVQAKAAQKLPKGFPLPEQFEMVRAEDFSWDFFIPQDYADVKSFYIQKFTSLNWKANPTPAPMEGEGEGGNKPTPQVGAMPTATIDLRPENDLPFTMPDGNEIELYISPHQNGTILSVELTLNNIASAGLPQDVPIYPGAVAQSISYGNVSFMVNADMNTIENYYADQLKAAGWAPNGNSFTSPTSFSEEWIKGDQKITIMVFSADSKTMLTIDCPTCRS